MKALTLDSFISQESDMEINQYHILSRLKEYQKELNKNKIYPSLSELVYLSSQLDEILDKKDNFSLQYHKKQSDEYSKRRLTILDIADQVIEYEEYVYDLIEWALPRIKSLIEEAYIIYKFIEDNITITEVGTSPIYKDEGYFLITNPAENYTQIHKYQSAIYSSESKPLHSIKTTFIENVKPLEFSYSAEILKNELIKRFYNRSNYATFNIEYDLVFPFYESIFPIAKRKLLNILSEY